MAAVRASEVDDGRENCDSQHKDQPFEIAAGQETREMQNQDRNGNDVEQHEQHSVSPSILVIGLLLDDYDDKIGKSLADEAHRQVERLDVLGQRAD
jgi:hypothetical protein